jgi:lantibiotic modifying enzyme
LSQTFPDHGWDTVARQHLRLAAEGTHQFPLTHSSLFGGSCGLAYTIAQFAAVEPRFKKQREKIDAFVVSQVQAEQLQRGKNPEVADSDYDVITGAAGALGYLVTIDDPTDEVAISIQMLIKYLIWLAEVDTPKQVQRWFISPNRYPLQSYRADYPDGYFNCGLAHGIPGPLAALAKAWQKGYRFPGQKEAILCIGNWLVDHHLQDSFGITWPSGIPLKASSEPTDWRQLAPAADGWCYGAPGVTRALWLAGKALNSALFCQVAGKAIGAYVQRSTTRHHAESPTFCHGLAGLLTICLRFVNDTTSESIGQQIPVLVDKILNQHNSIFPLGFKDLKPDHAWVDDPGLLTGASGIALALLSAARPIEPNWDQAFLIS